jgi:hypothetical protein
VECLDREVTTGLFDEAGSEVAEKPLLVVGTHGLWGCL